MIPSSQLLGLTRIVPPEKISQSLYLDRGQEVFKIERLRLANERPMALNVSYLPCHLCPTLDHEDLVTGSIYQIIETNYNLHIGYAKQILKPVVANKAEAQLLQVKVGSPLLQVEGVAFLANGTPIEYASLIYRGDSYEFPIQAIRQSGQLLSKELG